MTARSAIRTRPGTGVAERTELPVLHPGTDRLPTTCDRCGGRLLSPEPPLGRDRYGLLSCTSCGTGLAYLAALPRTIPSQRTTSPPATRLIDMPSPHASTRLADDSWRLPGCTKDCMRNQHAPQAHEAYGRRLALEELAARETRPTGLVVTGPLTIDLDSQRVSVDGDDVALSPTERKIVLYLAGRIGETCSAFDIVVHAWNAHAAEMEERKHRGRGGSRFHILRVNITRIRQRLGTAGRLIETVDGVGYLLRRATNA